MPVFPDSDVCRCEWNADVISHTNMGGDQVTAYQYSYSKHRLTEMPQNLVDVL